MEIGSFIELQLNKGKEFYSGEFYADMQIARLNSGRTGIYHAAACLACKTVYLPYYLCETVRLFLQKKGLSVRYYSLDESFTPLLRAEDMEEDSAVILVNYYGVSSEKRMTALAKKYRKVIIDNSQAFFAKPIKNCMNVYSARKFIGVPDGAYVIGKNAANYIDTYSQGYSSDTALFLLQRLEYGCEGKTYASRIINERRIDEEDVMKMSLLTQKILDGTDYTEIVQKRKENFEYASLLFLEANKINPLQYYAEDVVPMVYPLVIGKEGVLERLLEHKHFQGRWWSYVTKETPKECFENRISRQIIPITIDQRYGKIELDYLYKIIREET